METYFKKYHSKFWVNLVVALLFLTLTYTTYRYGGSWKLIPVFILAIISLYCISQTINSLTSYITRTVQWIDWGDFLKEIKDAPCLLKKIRPDKEYDYGAKRYDIDFEINNTTITLSNVPVFYKKEIEAVASSNDGQFRLLISKIIEHNRTIEQFVVTK